MTRDRALAIARACIAKEIKALAVEANLADRCGATYPAALAASARRSTLRDAIHTLEQPEQTRMKL